MKTITLILAVTVLAACGKGVVGAPKAHEAEMEPYLQQVVAEGVKRGLDYTDALTQVATELTDDTLYGELGECRIAGGTRTIRINRDTWKNLDDANRVSILTHEFGHCVLNRAHLDTYNSDSVAVSIMNHIAPDGYWIERDGDRYFTELFAVSQPQM